MAAKKKKSTRKKKSAQILNPNTRRQLEEIGVLPKSRRKKKGR